MLKKYTLQPKNELKQIKQMLTAAKWSPDDVLNDWLSNYWKQEVPERPWTIEDYLKMFKLMFTHAGSDVDYFLKDWKKNYRKKRKHKIVEKYRPDQKAFFEKWDKLSPKAFGVGLEGQENEFYMVKHLGEL